MSDANEIEIAVLKANMANVEKKVDSVISKIDDVSLLIQKQDLRDSQRGDEIKALKVEVLGLNTQVLAIKNRAWIERTSSAVLGAVLTGMIALIVFFLTK